MAGAMKTVTDDTFESEVLGSDKPVLVDFWADWCAPCKIVAPVLEEIAAEHADRLTVAKVDIDANPRLTRDFRILSVPTVSLFKGGALVASFSGAKPKQQILSLIESHL